LLNNCPSLAKQGPEAWDFGELNTSSISKGSADKMGLSENRRT